MLQIPVYGVPYERQMFIADRGAVVHGLLKLVLEQHSWILDLKNPFMVEAELDTVLQQMPRRHLALLERYPAVYHWTLQAVRELVMWAAARLPQNMQAEPLLPKIPLPDGKFITAKSPDMQFVMGGDGQHMLCEVKNGKASHYVMEQKLIKYGVAFLLDQHRRGNPLESVQLRWLGVRFPGEMGVPIDCQQILRVRSRKLRLEGADRWLRRQYDRGFDEILPDIMPVDRKVVVDPAAWWPDYKAQHPEDYPASV
ncbi:MAG: hypothetical protein DI628_06545 [Blastochloris viridis]|uniref:Uncharacterized protein n=1 Tax=Blastochloris viridis TaxID=1079 RepID=A0A6N4R8N3_BLAVI|nr:MAG: hypothetical protein DI628_06545 [Blastochloris viridis]